MKALIRNTLSLECEKHVHRYFEYLWELHEYTKRRSRREGKAFHKEIRRPPWWNLSPAFNPFKVRQRKTLATYANTLAAKIRLKTYKPRPALVQYITKDDGSRRRLNIFQLPDAAISKLVYISLQIRTMPKANAALGHCI
jgi:hypothetical protein